MKIIWMSDPHLQNAGTIGGLDPRARLKAALDHANAHYPDAAFVVMSGDLVGDEIEGDYALMADFMARSDLTVLPMAGNNDNRQGLLHQLPLPEGGMDGFVQYAVDLPECVLLCLDTHKEGAHAGAFCEARLAWLEQRLKQAGDKPVHVFMHHPPMALGLPKQDEIMLENGDAFLDVVARYNNVAHLYMGHVHRQTNGSLRGIPFATIGAVSFQAPAPRPEWDWESFQPPKEAPRYAVVDINGADVCMQHIQFCAYGVGLEGTS
ncbi:phosphodiesterase [Shimia sp. NS0008-38b]|uniref:metallophosphoesterase n=1 Tax=Shimia sp. NS0008-38b TaxID=3127653 RepID=UPI003106BCB0